MTAKCGPRTLSRSENLCIYNFPPVIPLKWCYLCQWQLKETRFIYCLSQTYVVFIQNIVLALKNKQYNFLDQRRTDFDQDYEEFCRQTTELHVSKSLRNTYREPQKFVKETFKLQPFGSRIN